MIISNEPITYPARDASTFAEMKIIRLSAKLEEDKMQVTVVLLNYDAATEEFDPERHAFSVHIDDLVAVSQVTRRIGKILKELDVVVQLVYNVQFLERKISAVEAADEDATQLRIDLNVARGKLNADPGIAIVR